MARDFGAADRRRIAREKRDAAAREAHEAAQAARPDERLLLKRAVTGELVTYTEAERGVGRRGAGPVIQTWWGYLVASLTIAFVGLLIAGGLVVDHLGPPPDTSWWLLPSWLLFWLPLQWYFLRNLRREHRAHRLRRAKGLPRPAE